jgi:hypothetical protein
MIKKFFKDITGMTAIALETARKEQEILDAELKDKARKEQEILDAELKDKARKEKAAEKKRLKKEIETDKKLSPKEIATKKKEPWVDVISFNVNKDNIRNGFYELDWNDLFILQLRQEGYGFDGDPEEEIVSRWFRDICLNAAEAEDIDMDERPSGHINVSKLQDSGNH